MHGAAADDDEDDDDSDDFYYLHSLYLHPAPNRALAWTIDGNHFASGCRWLRPMASWRQFQPETVRATMWY